MIEKDFNDLVQRRFETCKKFLERKGIEYASAGDRFHSFAKGYSVSLAETPEAYAWDLLSKHLQSIRDIVSHVKHGANGFPGQEIIDEKFTDAHNYLLFIEGLLTERIRNAKAN